MDETADTYGILDRVRGAVDVCATPAGERGVGEWMDLIGECSRALTVLSAARDAAIVRLAAIDETVDEDGVIRDKVNGLGAAGIDAGAMVSTATGTSTKFGEELVQQAITRVVRVPALHEAMLDGVLDDYKARCVASELTDVPPDLGRTVLDALSGDLSTRSGPALRKKTRDILFTLSPDLLRKRLKESRKGVGLRRWVGEPGTDRWGGSFPSEHAARAWAAIDALARQYRLDGTYPTLELARAHALLDLVNGNATVEAVLHLTVPASVLDGLDAENEFAADHGDGAVDVATEGAEPGATSDESPQAISDESARAISEAVAQSQRCASGPQTHTLRAGITFIGAAGVQGGELTWLRWMSEPGESPSWATRVSGSEDARSCHPVTGGLLDLGDLLASIAYRPGERLKALVRQRDGRCRFPSCVVSARSCDLDHVRPWPTGPTSASNLICLCRRHHRIKQRHRWRVTARGDGVVEWTDPRGRVFTTMPVDHLGVEEIRAIDLADDAPTPPVGTATDERGAAHPGGLRSPGTAVRLREIALRPWQQSPLEAGWVVCAEHGVATARAEARAGRRTLPWTRSWPPRRHQGGRGERVVCTTYPADELGIDVGLSDYYGFPCADPVSAGADDAPPF